MSKSNQLSLRDIRRVFRLLGEIRDLRHDPQAWRKHMIDGLCRLTGAKQGSAIAYGNFEKGKAPHVVQSILGGHPDAASVHFWMEYVQHHKHQADPLLKVSTEQTGRIYAGLLQDELLDRHQWLRSDWYNELCHPCGVFDAAIAFFREKSDLIQGISLHRPKSHRAFSQRDSDVLELFNRELYLMWREGLIDSVSLESQSSRPTLTRRQLEVLSELLAGHSERQIAKHLHISPHTVHDHVKAIYKACGVNSRAKLLSACLSPEGCASPPS